MSSYDSLAEAELLASGGAAGAAAAAAAAAEDKAAVAAAAAEAHKAQRGFIMPYYRLLRDNRGFRRLYAASFVSTFGDWFNYIASLTLITSLATSRGTAISIYLVLRRFPPLVFVPLVGYLADSFDRRLLMIVSDLIRIVVVAVLLVLAMIHKASLLWLIYICVFLHFSFAALFDPARAALVPQLVSADSLLTANVLDGSTRYALLFVGSSVGGIVTSFFGIQVDYVLDGVTFLLSSYLIWRLWVEVPLEGDPGYVALADSGDNTAEASLSSSDVEINLGGRSKDSAASNDGGDAVILGISSDEVEEQEHAAFEYSPSSEVELMPFDTDVESGKRPFDSDTSVLGKIKGGFAFWLRNPYILALTCIRSLVAIGGGSNLLNILFAEEVYRFSFDHDGSLTLGIMYAVVGMGAFVGPNLVKRFTPPHDQAREVAFIGAMVLMNIGSYVTASVPSFYVFLLSNLVRVAGGSTIMTMGSALLQTKVPNEVRGRVFAIDISLFTLSYTTVVVLVGQAIDHLHWSPFKVQLYISFAYTGMFLLCAPYLKFFSHRDRPIR
ncbi:major facilitator superfamily transporter MFS_1 [Thecamonas trahens ATCC 50062]|uniref:Major facilitator superfamily transporter MFS_1 n=1 Tax=Thecamonas trahens ATCC 50062 TaxID=461836 RepID=A0A0L0D777_THETB|nr:major facilitator superfamily transporter MFS_1 [Thecamonas trahens ATCC 50062]KNC48199.1 major facilitator superfamily transporter MFS_1 [Thecamonas trahens ATCC 50062]|eukprot:XP_013758768.1 major facilitator superfamily transporter MFS_1 [Thecamonas trahens ATCC 50062]